MHGFGVQRNRGSSFANETGSGAKGQKYNSASTSAYGSNNRVENNSVGGADLWKRNESSRNSLQPNHSYHSSYSSSCSSVGRSSADREELLHLQQYLAKEVPEKSRLVAVRALASSPGPRHDFPHQRYRDPISSESCRASNCSTA